MKKSRIFRRAKKIIQSFRQRSPLAYQRPSGPFTLLGGEATSSVAMSVNSAEESRPKGELYRIWQGIPGGHKWWHYFDAYERFLGEFKSKPIRFLEVGVYNGGSLAMWRQYLHKDSIIVGLDIDTKCAQYEDKSANVHVRIGDQSDKVFLAEVIKEFGPFDVILDDGSHICSHMIKTFEYAFLNGLTESGIYIAEDTHSNFWLSYRDQEYSFIDLCKDLIDISHSHYHNHDNIYSFTLGSGHRLKSIDVPRIGAEIQEISFLDSIVVIKRNRHRGLPTTEHL
ncbi:MAG: hypothetical protein QM709_01925 [Spongiibacteraceae bacterium]